MDVTINSHRHAEDQCMKYGGLRDSVELFNAEQQRTHNTVGCESVGAALQVGDFLAQKSVVWSLRHSQKLERLKQRNLREVKDY